MMQRLLRNRLLSWLDSDATYVNDDVGSLRRQHAGFRGLYPVRAVLRAAKRHKDSRGLVRLGAEIFAGLL